MKEFKKLKILDKISFIFKIAGVDYSIMRKILQVKFTMDERRTPTIMMNGKNDSKSKNTSRSALIIYGLIGLFIGALMFMDGPLFLKMNIIMGMLIFMIMTTMISDFSSVLLDIEDKNILLPRPVDGKTLNAAKLVHIVIYLLSITIAITGGSLLFGFIHYGLFFFIIFFVDVSLICGFAILFTSLFYYAILSFFSGEKLKDLINYFQILLTIFTTVMYQFIGRIFDITDLTLVIKFHWWDFLLPSAWFAAPFSLLVEKDYNSHYVLLSACAVIIPIITVILYAKVIAPKFEKKLQKLNDVDSNKKRAAKYSLGHILEPIICIEPLEKVFFRFVLQMLNNERKLKLKLYPSIALSLVVPIIIFFNVFSEMDTNPQVYAQIRNGTYYLYLYFTVSFLSSMFPFIRFSENYKGAWIYKALPVENPGIVIRGAFKAFVCKYVLSIYLLISIGYMLLFGIRILPDVILIFINMLILMLCIFYLSKKNLPFSRDYQYVQEDSSMVKGFFSLLLSGAIFGVHYIFLIYIPFGIVINIGISLLILAILWHYSFQISWEKLIEDAT